MLLLVPDVEGGFGFFRAAQADPGNAIWSGFAQQLTHAPWRGSTIWDLVMPVFVFVVGLSMALSMRRKVAGPAVDAREWHSAGIRVATLIILGLLLLFSAKTAFEQLLPLMVLAAAAVNVDSRAIGPSAGRGGRVAADGLRIAVLCLALWTMLAHVERLAIRGMSSQILILLGLAYLPAFALFRWNRRGAVYVATMLLLLHGLLFAAFAAMPGVSVDGAYDPWSRQANVGGALDHYFYATLLRDEEYVGDLHGYHLLQFVPLIFTIVAGAACGRVAASNGRSERSARMLVVGGACGLVAGLALDACCVPMIKSIWTLSWSVFSTSAAILLLGVLLEVCAKPRVRVIASPLVILGTNPVLLYVLGYLIAHQQRWRIVDALRRTFGFDWLTQPWHHVAHAGIVFLVLFAVAAALHRAKIRIRV